VRDVDHDAGQGDVADAGHGVPPRACGRSGTTASAQPLSVGRWERGPAGQDNIVRVVGWYRCRRGATIETVQNLGAVTPLAGTAGGPIVPRQRDLAQASRWPVPNMGVIKPTYE
jgi:hypothetical protein